MKYVNHNDHPVRVRQEGGGLRRVRSGEVVSADGVLADNLAATVGVAEATQSDEDRWTEIREARAEQNRGIRSQTMDALSSARQALRAATVSAPLQVVVGDDQAPQGPPTGTVTTKQAIIKGTDDPLEKLAFGGTSNALLTGEVEEAPPSPAGEVSGTVVHNAQVAAAEATAEVVDLMAEITTSGGADSGYESGSGNGEAELAEDEVTVESLKDQLRERDLPVSGNKQELIDRLAEDDAQRADDGQAKPDETGTDQ